MLFPLLPIFSLLVSGVEGDESDDASLLQLVGKVNDDGGSVSSLRDETGFPLYLDFKSRYESQRKRVPTLETKNMGTPYEIAMHFKDLEKQGIVINATHAVFPTGHMVQAQFLRKNWPLQTREFGIANMRWQPKSPDLPSAMQYTVASAEKVHTLYHKGPWRTESYKFALKDQAAQAALADELPKPGEVRKEKTVKALLLTLLGRLGIQFMRAGTDPLDVASVATLSGKAAPRRFSRMKAKLQKQLSRNDARITKKVSRKDTPEGTGNNCFHLMDTSDGSALPSVVVASDGSGFAVRLDTLVQSFRGETTVAPLESSSFTRGGTVLSHDTVANELRVYHQSSSLFRAEDIDGTHLDPNPTFYLGSLTPRRGPLEPDARRSIPSPSDEKHALWNSFRALPMDYAHLFDATCVEGGSDNKHLKAKEAYSSLNTMEMVRALGDPSFPDAEKHRVLLGVSEMFATHSDCSAAWLRSSIRNSHGFGFNGAAVMIHMSTEFLPSQLADIILDPNWNNLDLSRAF